MTYSSLTEMQQELPVSVKCSSKAMKDILSFFLAYRNNGIKEVIKDYVSVVARKSRLTGTTLSSTMLRLKLPLQILSP